MNIVLIGYMGSGKSSIAKELHNILNYDFVDLDTFIEEKEELTIPEIFRLKGEIYFRKKESLYLKEVLNNSQQKIISLGGGTPCYGDNMNLLSENCNCYSIYLKSSIRELSKRLYLEREKRPLISHIHSKDSLEEFIGKHLFERLSFYDKSDLTITTDNKTVHQIAKEIITNLF